MPLRHENGKRTTLKLRRRPRIEALEDRLAPAVQLSYGGPGTVLGLQEIVAGKTAGVTIAETAPNQLEISLGTDTFDSTSTVTALGLTYEHSGSPATSHFATVNISQSNDITTLQATLPGDDLTLGVTDNSAGGLGNLTASAAIITVLGLNTSNAAAGAGNVDLKAAGTLSVSPSAEIDTGQGTLALAAGVNADGTPASAGSEVTVADAGFETPGVGSGTYAYAPTGSPWTYTGSAGVSGNSSLFTGNNPNSPEGSQVGLLQQQGEMSQSIDFSAGFYAVSFLAAQRSGDPACSRSRLRSMA